MSGPWPVWLALLALTTTTSTPVSAQPPSIRIATSGSTLHVSAPGFHFIAGDALERLKDGRALRVELEIEVLGRPGGSVVARAADRFNVSYDLWEERFAIARLGAPGRSVSHLTQADAERWCLEQLGVPLAAVRRRGPDDPFWIRLHYRVIDPEERDAGNGTFTLYSLIDRLSRRRSTTDVEESAEAGPFRLSD